MTVPPGEDPHERYPGLEPGGGVVPGETPPIEDDMSWAGGRAYRQPDLPHDNFWNRFGLVVTLCGTVLLGVLLVAYAVVRAMNL